MWQQIALGTFLVLVTTFLHTVATAVALTRLKGAVRMMPVPRPDMSAQPKSGNLRFFANPSIPD